MLFSTTGVRISQHWCGDALINATIWGDAEPCEHYGKAEKPACPFHAKMQAKKKCCSEREIIILGGEDDFLAQAIYFTTFQPSVIGLISVTHLFDRLNSDVAEQKFHNHSPPLILSSIFLWIACFRI